MARLAEAAGRRPADLSLDTDLRVDLAIDSLDIVEMLIEVEDRFGIVLTDRDLAGVTTVGDALCVMGAARDEA